MVFPLQTTHTQDSCKLVISILLPPFSPFPKHIYTKTVLKWQLYLIKHIQFIRGRKTSARSSCTFAFQLQKGKKFMFKNISFMSYKSKIGPRCPELSF